MTSQVDRAIQLAHDQGETIIGLRRQLAEAKRERDALEEQLKESLADRVAGAAAHQLCSQERNDLRGELAEAERQRDDLLTLADEMYEEYRWVDQGKCYTKKQANLLARAYEATHPASKEAPDDRVLS